jgi:hypothetical protein
MVRINGLDRKQRFWPVWRRDAYRGFHYQPFPATAAPGVTLRAAPKLDEGGSLSKDLAVPSAPLRRSVGTGKRS